MVKSKYFLPSPNKIGTLINQLKITLRFFRYYFQAKTRYSIHSPFVFDFVEAVLEDYRQFYAFPIIEQLRKQLLKDRRKVKISDYGAGSLVSPYKIRSIRSLAKHSATSAYYCQLLFRTIQHFKPQTLLELGTSLGISSLYQSSAASGSRYITIEGCPNVAREADANFRKLNARNVELIVGQFDLVLPKVLSEIDSLDYVFIDGNHREKPTVDYFEACLEKSNENSLFVFDDIHWSDGMERAWETIKGHPKVTLTIDLFYFGLVFFRKEQKEKEHFQIVPSRWKPWRLGFFR